MELFGHHHDKEEDKLLRELIRVLRDIHRTIALFVPVEIQQTFEGESGCMADITKNVGSTVHSVPVEKNAEGGNVPIVPGNIQYSVDDPTIGKLTQNPDGSADVLGLAAGTVNLTVTDTQFKLANTKALGFQADTTPTSIDQALS